MEPRAGVGLIAVGLVVVFALHGVANGNAEWNVEPLRDGTAEHGFRVPSSIGEAAQLLRSVESAENRLSALNSSSMEFGANEEFGLGGWIRRAWLYDGSPLTEAFKKFDLPNRHSASGVILDAYWLNVRGERLDEAALIAEAVLRSREVTPPVPGLCPDSKSEINALFRDYEERSPFEHRLLTYGRCSDPESFWVYEIDQGWKQASVSQAAEIRDFLGTPQAAKARDH